MHGRFLFEPEKFPDAWRAHGVYNEHFGPIEKRNNSDFCVFAFEPNPAHKARHLELQDVYGKLGWRYHFENYAVSDFEGNLTFIHQDDGTNNEWGFSTQEGRGGEQTNETIPSIRFTKWMEEHIQNRIIPEEPTNKDALPPTVVMKFDIEGGEWEVMFDLLFSGILCDVVDYSFGELHPWIRHRFIREVFQIFNDQKDGNCKTKSIDILDDEAYHMDGIPLPDVPE
jgi:FkbM family methyltransferase